MKSFVPIFLVLASAAACPALCADDKWPLSPEAPIGRPACSLGHAILNNEAGRSVGLERFLQSSLDPSCLSNPKARAVFHVKVSGDNIPEVKVLRSSHATAADVFYCEQAIWEALPAKVSDAETDVDYQATPVDTRMQVNSLTEHPPNANFTHFHWPSLHPEDKATVKLHFVPHLVAKRDGAYLAYKDIEAKANVESLAVNQIRNLKLDEFRKDWFEFIVSHPQLTRAQLMEQVSTMKEKYKDLFRTDI